MVVMGQYIDIPVKRKLPLDGVPLNNIWFIYKSTSLFILYKLKNIN